MAEYYKQIKKYNNGRRNRRGRRNTSLVSIIVVLLLMLGSMLLQNKEQSHTGQGQYSQNQGQTVSINGQIQLELPPYSGEPSVIIHDNQPFFTEEEKTTEAFEQYTELDSLGRCVLAYANVSRELMPTGKRGYIGDIKPTGWKQKKYPELINTDPPYLYNRCHLIAYCLTAENDNRCNLITGTRYMNEDGMLPYEELVAKYLDRNDHHVLYRVTPIFEGDNLVASGVLMEAYSVEDQGEGICFCVYCYNVQPGVEIDYATGYNQLSK